MDFNNMHSNTVYSCDINSYYLYVKEKGVLKYRLDDGSFVVSELSMLVISNIDFSPCVTEEGIYNKKEYGFCTADQKHILKFMYSIGYNYMFTRSSNHKQHIRVSTYKPELRKCSNIILSEWAGCYSGKYSDVTELVSYLFEDLEFEHGLLDIKSILEENLL